MTILGSLTCLDSFSLRGLKKMKWVEVFGDRAKYTAANSVSKVRPKDVTH